ncbi:MAG TPA: hypothetical protein DCY86_00040 [Bdellovibrionales bacterium]|nr:hypothetical protein [Bdellovibrionales bacterium]
MNNVFLHYLNHDTQEIFQLDKRFYRSSMHSLLLQTLYVSILICKEYCFIPLGFLYESKTTRQLLRNVQPFFSEKLIRICLREQDIERYIAKKKKGLLPYKNIPIYSPFFVKNPQKILKDIGAPLIDRETRIGGYCLTRWQHANETLDEPEWKLIYSSMPDGATRAAFRELMLSFPERYSERPFIWPSVEEHLSSITPKTKAYIRRVFEKYYYEAYVQEYEACILFDLPFATCDFGLSVKWTPIYSYSLFRNWLHMLNLSEYISLALPEGIIRLKFAPEFISLRDIYLNTVLIFPDADVIQSKLAALIQDKAVSNIVTKLRDRLGLNTVKYNHTDRDIEDLEKDILKNSIKQTQRTYNTFNFFGQISDSAIGLNSRINSSPDTGEIYFECSNPLPNGGQIMSKYDFRGANINQGAIGDNPLVNNYNHIQQQVDQYIATLQQEILNLETETQARLHSLVDSFAHQVRLSESNPQKVQEIWNEIKEGVKTSGAATTILLGLKALLGF